MVSRTPSPSEVPSVRDAWSTDWATKGRNSISSQQSIRLSSGIAGPLNAVQVQPRIARELDGGVTRCYWTRLWQGIKAIWKPRFTGDNADARIKTTLRELVVYCTFLSVVCLVTFGMTNSHTYYYTKVMSQLFLDATTEKFTKSFQGITEIEDFWNYVQEPLLNGLYWEKWYNGWNLSDDKLGYIYYENKLLGLPRLRMLKVRSDSCEIPKAFEREIKECYDAYASAIEDKRSFGKKNGTAWNFASSKELKSGTHWGYLATYSGAGFVQDLALNRVDSAAAVADLKNNRWIDRGTRAVFVDFSVYNANINLFCVVKLLFEFPPTGGVLTSSSIRTVKLIRYVTPFDYFVLACEGIFVAFVVYYVVEELMELKRLRLKYLKSYWNLLDFTMIFIAICCIAFSVYRQQSVDSKLSSLLSNQEQYVNFEFLSFAQTRFNDAVALMVFFTWIKFFKYISFNKTFTQLTSTLSRCAKDVGGFAIMFFIFFFAYVQLGYLIFGTQVKDFSTFYDSTFTLLRTILGDFDFHQLEEANRILGPIFFISYVFFVFFVLLNMFLAIINDTYAEVKEELQNAKADFDLSNFVKKKCNSFMNKLNIKKERIMDLQHALSAADLDKDSNIDFCEWRQHLKQRGYSDQEIEVLFLRYDANNDGVLNEDEQEHFRQRLRDEKMALDNEMLAVGRPLSAVSSPDSAANFADFDFPSAALEAKRCLEAASANKNPSADLEEFQCLKHRVDRMDKLVGSIISKVDSFGLRMGILERVAQAGDCEDTATALDK